MAAEGGAVMESCEAVGARLARERGGVDPLGLTLVEVAGMAGVELGEVGVDWVERVQRAWVVARGEEGGASGGAGGR